MTDDEEIAALDSAIAQVEKLRLGEGRTGLSRADLDKVLHTLRAMREAIASDGDGQ
jgi:hypothetical protein